jgi:hypothetical protein
MSRSCAGTAGALVFGGTTTAAPVFVLVAAATTEWFDNHARATTE